LNFNKLNLKNITLLWRKVTGSIESPLESRIFHAVCVISLFVLAFSIIVNLLISARIAALLMFGVFIFLSGIFYYSRFKGKLKASIVIFGISSNLFFIINYLVNSGVNGPGLQIFILSFFLIIAIAPKKQYAYWVVFNVLTVIVLLGLDSNYPNLIQSTYIKKTDRIFDFGYSYVAIVGLILVVMLYIRNTYYRQQLALQIKAKQLEDSNQTRNKLLSVVAHDLRSPLHSIQGYLEILSEFKLTDEEKRTIELDLLEKTKNTGEMLSNLLSWTMNQMSGVKANLTPTNLNETLDIIVKLQTTQAKDKGIELKNEVDPSACVMADSNMIQLVVRNLLSNAIKFTPTGGKVILTTEDHNGECYLIIKDNGVGIAGKRKEEIFSIKSESTYGTQNEKGAGLGLVLCREFTELQNGRIWFESVLGTGTSFYIALHKCNTRVAGVHINPDNIRDSEQQKIL
jgi:two-component system sensor histidine kinase/response regulator